MASSGLMTEAEQRSQERRIFQRELREAEEGDPVEIREAADELLNDMRVRPEWIGESIGDMIRGVYGRGAQDASREVLQNPKMNRQAWLLVTIAALDWHVPSRFVRRAFNALTPAEQRRLKQQIAGAIGRVRQQLARERRLYELVFGQGS